MLPEVALKDEYKVELPPLDPVNYNTLPFFQAIYNYRGVPTIERMQLIAAAEFRTEIEFPYECPIISCGTRLPQCSMVLCHLLSAHDICIKHDGYNRSPEIDALETWIPMSEIVTACNVGFNTLQRLLYKPDSSCNPAYSPENYENIPNFSEDRFVHPRFLTPEALADPTFDPNEIVQPPRPPKRKYVRKPR